MNMKKKVCLLLMALTLACASVPAFAADNSATIEVTGTVVNIRETPVITVYGGTLADVLVQEGSHVSAGDPIASLATNKVYAKEDGTARVFGNVGDSVEMLTERYGAVAYVEPDVGYTISASTKNAYDAEENKVIHPGEAVYLRGSTKLTDTGTGTVTQVSGTSFTVEITSGNFSSGESISVFRSPDYDSAARIGKGSASRKEYTAYQGEGIVVLYHVADGSPVKKGDLLYETVAGEYKGSAEAPTLITAPVDGIISSLAFQRGDAIVAGDTICKLYPDDSMRVRVSVDEEGLNTFHPGDNVTVRFTYIGNGEYTQTGTIEEISGLGVTDETGESEEAFYSAVIRLDDKAQIRYGMTVTVTD